MKSGRKNLKKASAEDGISLQNGQSIMQVVSLRGSNVIEKGVLGRDPTPLELHTRTHQHQTDQRWVDERSKKIHVMDAKGLKSLALFPAKFQRSFWIKTGNFVIVDEGGREKALESGDKIACIVSQVLFHAQVRSLERSPDWPASFKNGRLEEPKNFQLQPESFHGEVLNSDSEDDLPPLEANLNRCRPVELYSDTDSDHDS